MINLKGKARLLEEYQEVEYIGSDTSINGYIQIPFYATNKTELYTSFSLIDSNYGGVANYRGSGNQGFGCSVWGTLAASFGSQQSASQSFIKNTKYDFAITKGSITLNGNVILTIDRSVEFITPLQLYVVGNRTTSGGGWFGCRGLYYETKIKEDSILVYDLVPCYRKEDNKPGMYDLVSGQFFTNQGSGEFIVGPDYEQVQPKNITINKDGNTYDCKRVVCNDTVIWEKASKYADRDMSYFTIKPSSPLCLVKLQGYGTLASIDLSKGSGQYLDYRFDNEDGTYSDWVHYTNGSQIASQGKPIQFRGCLLTSAAANRSNYWRFEDNGQPWDVYGNLRAIYDNTANYHYHYERLFYGSSVVDASGLIIPMATDALMYKYDGMFQQCTKLKYAPNISGWIRNYGCCNMFNGCTSLIKAPKMDNIQISGGANFQGMFINCTSLQYPPMNFKMENVGTTTITYEKMFQGCSSLKFTPKINIPNPSTTSLCKDTFQSCSNLKIADLSKIYKVTGSNTITEMFDGCENLNYIKLGLISAATSVNTNIFRNVSSTGTALIRPEANQSVYSIIPSGWDIEYMDWTDMSVEPFTPYVYNGGVETNINISFKEDELLIKTILLNTPTNYKVIFTDVDGNQTESSFYRDDFYVVGDYVQYSCESTKQGLYIDNGDCYLDSYDWDADDYAITSIASIEIVRLSDEATIAAYSFDDDIATMSIDEDEEYNEINEETDETNQEF